MQFNNEEVEMIFMEMDERMDKTENVLLSEFANIRTGRANPKILDKIEVDYYGTMSPINQVGNISVPEARMMTITPWDATMLSKIEKAILAANIGLTPSNDGKIIRLVFPLVTEERRKELVKQCKTLAEEAKVAIRNVRRDALDKLKKMKTAKTITEDEAALYEKEVEKVISKHSENIDKMSGEKEKEIMVV